MFEAFSVAVKVSLINQVSSGLITLSRQFATVHGNAVALKREIKSIGLLMAGGAMVAGAGAMGLGIIGKTLPYAKEYAHQLQQMNISGMKQAEIARSINAAWAAGKSVPTSSAAESLASIRELRMVFGNTSDAITNMPTVQRLQAVLQNVSGGRGQDEAYTVAKALELKGAVRTPGQFTGQADLMSRAMVASAGKVNANDFLLAFKYGRGAANGWDNQFTYSILPTLIQEMKTRGGSGGVGGPGNALMSMYAAVVGGAVPQRSIPEWAKLGLLDPSKVIRTRTGATKGLLPGAIAGGDVFQRNPFEWVQTVLLPAMAKSGLSDDSQKRQALQYLFPNRTAGFMAGQMATQDWKFIRDQKLIGGAQGLSAYNTLLKNDPEMASLALHKQWQSLLAILGFQIMPVLIKGTLMLVNLFHNMATFAKEHPTLTKIFVTLFAALSGLLVISGGVLMIAGAIGAITLAFTLFGPVIAGAAAGIAGTLGLIGLPLAIFVGGLTALYLVFDTIKKHWDSSKSVWVNIKTEIGQLLNWLAHAANIVWNMLPAPVRSSIAGVANGAMQFGIGMATGSPFVAAAGAGKMAMSFVGELHIDGKKAGPALAKGMANAMGGPATGSGTFDDRQHMPLVGMGAR